MDDTPAGHRKAALAALERANAATTGSERETAFLTRGVLHALLAQSAEPAPVVELKPAAAPKATRKPRAPKTTEAAPAEATTAPEEETK